MERRTRIEGGEEMNPLNLFGKAPTFVAPSYATSTQGLAAQHYARVRALDAELERLDTAGAEVRANIVQNIFSDIMLLMHPCWRRP